MDFSLTDEQQMIIKTTRDFVANELYPHEARRSKRQAYCAQVCVTN